MKYNLPKDGGLKLDSTPKDILRRFEKIPTTVFQNESIAVQYVAEEIIRMINNHDYQDDSITDVVNNPFVLGLSTGKTPVGLYRELTARYQNGDVSFRNVVVYSLDELFPINPNDEQSRNFRIHEDFLNQLDIDPENIHIPDGTIDLDQTSTYCERFESNLNHIDLMIMGMGSHGQIGFNEPGTYYGSRTRLVQLNDKTRESLLPIFHTYSDIPEMAITMGIGTILRADKIILLSWGEEKAEIVRAVVEGEISVDIPASYLQAHHNIEVVIDENAAQLLTREQTPWLVGPCEWTPKFIRRAVVWLCEKVNKPILKLVYQDYISNSLGQLLNSAGKYDKVNIDVFNDLQHTITGWPGGKPNIDDSTRPVPSKPFPKRVLIFSPHPDDDVISMGGTFLRLVEQGHDVHVAYQTSGSVAVYDDVVVQMIDTARELRLGDNLSYIKELIASKKVGEPEPKELLDVKASIRRAEARAACRHFGVDEETNVHFLNMPFYETGGIKKGHLSETDTQIIVDLLREIQPHQIYAVGDLSDPHGTYRICIEAVLNAVAITKNDPWIKDCAMWLYRGALQEWNLGFVDMAVPLSPDELIKKRHAIYRHLSQKGVMPVTGSDSREFWQRADERTQTTARLYDRLGMAEYQAIEVFVKMF